MAELDARTIDSEVLNLLRGNLGRLFDPIDPDGIESIRPELDAAFTGALWWNCVWRDRPTPGMAMLGLQYSDGRATSRGSPARPSQSQRLLLGAFWVLVPWAHERFRRAGLSRGWPFRPPDSIEARVWRLLERARGIYKFVYLMNLLAYLRGRRQYPTIAERVAGVQLEPDPRKAKDRSINVQFMNRQLLWDALTSFALFAAPFVDRTTVTSRAAAATVATSGLIAGTISRVSNQIGIARLLERYTEHFGRPLSATVDHTDRRSDNGGEGDSKSNVSAENSNNEAATTGDCAECGCARACMPVEASCGHTFCYFCMHSLCSVSTAQSKDYCCPRCNAVVVLSETRQWVATEPHDSDS
jgi:peroxin-2